MLYLSAMFDFERFTSQVTFSNPVYMIINHAIFDTKQVLNEIIHKR